MNLKRLELEGFRSYRDPLTLSFSEGITFITGQNFDQSHTEGASNGSGKTGILDAISWMLYGRDPEGRSKDDLMNFQSDRVRGVLFLDDLVIERSKERGSGEQLRYKYKGSPWTDTEKANLHIIQSQLESIYGISFTTFCNTVYLSPSSNTVKFLSARPSDRVKIMGELINDEVYTETARILRQWKRTCKQKQAEAWEHRKRLKRILEETKEELQGVKKVLREQALNRENKQLEIKQKIRDLKKEITRLQDDVLAAPKDVIEDLNERIEATKIRIAKSRKYEGKFEHIIGLGVLESGDLCPTCNRKMTYEHEMHLHQQKREAKEKLRRQSDIRKKDERVLVELEARKATLRDLEAARIRAIRDIESMQAEIRRLKDELQPTEDKYLLKQQAKYEAQVKKLSQDIKELSSRYTKESSKETVLDKLIPAFGEEIRNMLLDRQRTTLTHYCKAYLEKLANREYQLFFPEQTSTGKDKFVITVLRGGQEVPVNTLSTGEKLRSLFSVLFGLRQSMLEGKCCPFQFMLLDELGEGLDHAGRRAVSDLLADMAGTHNFGTILVTLPHDDLAVGHQTINVVKQGKVSSIR